MNGKIYGIGGAMKPSGQRLQGVGYVEGAFPLHGHVVWGGVVPWNHVTKVGEAIAPASHASR